MHSYKGVELKNHGQNVAICSLLTEFLVV